jgi:DNA repair exonuclease SbcCD nuclease subunit
MLFIADTHLGFDLPFRPRVVRRRRGPDFFRNFERALAPALDGSVDCVVHGGDLLYRSKVPAKLVTMAFEPLKRVADRGTPVFLVPGNHERSEIPYRLLAAHPKIHVFDRPKTLLLSIDGFHLAISGFPYVRDQIRKNFPRILERTGWRQTKADGHILCIHHCLEGATVGPNNYMFRYHEDVIKANDIPTGFAAILSGHIHRFQVITKDLRGRPIAAPVLYPGSIERTSFAERDEKKGYLTLEIETSGLLRGRLKSWIFHELPTRPMRQVELHADSLGDVELSLLIRNTLEKLPEDSIVKIKLYGEVHKDSLSGVTAASLRSLAPPTMNVIAVLFDNRRWVNAFSRGKGGGMG